MRFLSADYGIDALLDYYEQNRMFKYERLTTDVLTLKQNHQTNILIAPPGSGKTAYCLQQCLKLAKQHVHCLYVTSEMSAMSLITRLVANESNIKVNDIEDCKVDIKIIKQCVSDIMKSGRISFYEFQYNKDKLENIIIEFMRNADTKQVVVFYDYLQNICFDLNGHDARTRTENTLMTLSKLAAKYNYIQFIVSASNRQSYNSVSLDAARETSSIEYCADSVTLMQLVTFNSNSNRFVTVDKEKYADEMQKQQVYIKFSVIKNRHDNTSSTVMLFDKTTQRFTLVTEDIASMQKQTTRLSMRAGKRRAV